jgi:hypothetical protein
MPAANRIADDIQSPADIVDNPTQTPTKPMMRASFEPILGTSTPDSETIKSEPIAPIITTVPSPVTVIPSDSRIDGARPVHTVWNTPNKPNSTSSDARIVDTAWGLLTSWADGFDSVLAGI